MCFFHEEERENMCSPNSVLALQSTPSHYPDLVNGKVRVLNCQGVLGLEPGTFPSEITSWNFVLFFCLVLKKLIYLFPSWERVEVGRKRQRLMHPQQSLHTMILPPVSASHNYKHIYGACRAEGDLGLQRGPSQRGPSHRSEHCGALWYHIKAAGQPLSPNNVCNSLLALVIITRVSFR